ncbi:MAG: hypothetical protein MK538_00030, partial [Planctomycetes bacterium]|nr:hypothetical protein [Planctomycetota bacterium]
MASSVLPLVINFKDLGSYSKESACCLRRSRRSLSATRIARNQNDQGYRATFFFAGVTVEAASGALSAMPH